MHEARRELEERDARLTASAERLTQTAERLAQTEKRITALEERLLMTEESERHAAEQQARAEESRETLVAQISAMQVREAQLREEQESERNARARVESELERLRGSFATMTPLVHALHEATGEIQVVLAHEPEASVAQSGGHGGNAGGGGGIAAGTPPAAADLHGRANEGEQAARPARGGPRRRRDVERGEASLLGALVDVVERWRTQGPAN